MMIESSSLYVYVQDICKQLYIDVENKDHLKQLVWAGVHDLKLTYRDTHHKLESG